MYGTKNKQQHSYFGVPFFEMKKLNILCILHGVCMYAFAIIINILLTFHNFVFKEEYSRKKTEESNVRVYMEREWECRAKG